MGCCHLPQAEWASPPLAQVATPPPPPIQSRQRFRSYLDFNLMQKLKILKNVALKMRGTQAANKIQSWVNYNKY
jgi:hypothetical protein